MILFFFAFYFSERISSDAKLLQPDDFLILRLRVMTRAMLSPVGHERGGMSSCVTVTHESWLRPAGLDYPVPESSIMAPRSSTQGMRGDSPNDY